MIIGQILLAIIWLLAAIIVHEYGHYFMAKKYGKASIRWDKSSLVTTFPDNLTAEQKINIYLTGILVGYVVTASFAFINPWITMIIFLLYIGGCAHDMKAIKKIKDAQIF